MSNSIRYPYSPLYIIVVFAVFFLSACSYQLSRETSDELKLQTPRYGHASATDGENIFVFAGSKGRKFLSDVEIIDPINGTVKVLKDKVIPRRYFSAVWDGKDSIYLIGGVSYTGTIAKLENTVEIFNIHSFEVTLGAPIPAPRRNSRSVLLDDRIYVLGGSTASSQRQTPLKSTALTAAYNITSNKWIKLADMPTAKSTSPITKDGNIYVAGGFNHQSALNVFERFDPNTNQWLSLTKLPRPVSGHSAVYAQNKLFLFGDYKNLDSVLMYDFDKKTWSEPQINYQPSRHNTSVVFGEYLYVIGGNINSKGPSLDSIQRFTL
jgi:hypothetical protein